MHKFVKGKYYAEDNNGGDIIEIEYIEGNIFEFKVGNCCVITIKIIGTISEITEKLTEMRYKEINNE